MQVFISRSRNLVETGYPREEHEAYYYFKNDLTFLLFLSHPSIIIVSFLSTKIVYNVVRTYNVSDKNFFSASSSRITIDPFKPLYIDDPQSDSQQPETTIFLTFIKLKKKLQKRTCSFESFKLNSSL